MYLGVDSLMTFQPNQISKQWINKQYNGEVNIVGQNKQQSKKKKKGQNKLLKTL